MLKKMNVLIKKATDLENKARINDPDRFIPQEQLQPEEPEYMDMNHIGQSNKKLSSNSKTTS
jgi:hypothetical protein